ncbi:MAG TPA: TAT-variant-translocated molybdopterin oxidoreductase, partial [Thermoanaerobaculia bacterium]|nr:TAT-variant-translocated molybdopterin oxidoreductase [Thermoanaerobaculia bacterium]
MDSVKSKGKCGAEPGAQAGPAQLDLGDLRQRLKDKKGPEFWRSLDELAGSPDFEAMVHREFPRYAAEWPSGFSRRRFLQLSSASMALAGLTGCTKQPIEKIVPYVRQPEQIIPGKPLFFATALTLSGYATGVLAESHEGRPTKVEGNPDHPASLGATDVFAQASILTLYDPDRSQTILRAGRPGTWGAFVGEVSSALRSLAPTGGDGLRILTGSVTSPTFASQMQALLAAYPRARWHRWEPAASHQAQAAARRALGAPLDKVYDFTQADVVLTIGSDAFCHGPAGVRYARDFSSRRRVRAANKTMNRLYAVESFPENSSTVADHRLQRPPDQVEAFTLALAQALGVAGAGGAALADETARQWVGAVAEDLRAHSGRSLVVADEFLSPALQVLVLGINQALGNVGRTLHFTEPVEADPVDQVQSMRELVADMNAGRVELLVMLDGVNPVYTAPADLRFDQALQKVRLRVHHGLYEDETSVHCHWHVNAAHELESWGDARAFDGTVSILQPLIDPLYEGRTASEMLAALGNRPDSTGYDLVRELWSGRLAAPEGFETAWRRVLHAGLVPNTAAARTGATVNGGAVAQAAGEIAAAAGRQGEAPVEGRVTLLVRPDPTIWDGRFASNAWLQELPKPVSKLVWDNALTVSPRTAERLKIDRYQIVTVAAGGRSIEAAVWILPGMADDTAYLTLGYGRTRAGK